MALFLLPSDHLSAQTTITGCVTDASERSPVEYVSVILFRFSSNQIVTYSFSNQEGCFRLAGVPQGVFTLKATMLGYHPFTQQLVIAADSVLVPLTIALVPRTTELEVVEIRGVQPIIVKQDTIIYNVGHWTQATDRTLEEVLGRIPGFKIRGDGELSLNGKPIDKVIIDGKEISDGGAALNTRSISPEDVKEIQVRLDEKDAALKESLIDTRKLVVLDIRLRDDMNKSLFGVVRGSVGQQQTARPGGYGNLFSLGKKTNLHLFAEYDQFGEQTISLDQVKNIGQEAFQKIFDVPADFNEIAEKQDLNREIYGFKDYTRSITNVLGATGAHRISDRVQLFAGSYNSYQLMDRQRNYQQRFFGGPETGFDEATALKNFSSKNKLEIRFDYAKIKARLDVNTVIMSDRSSMDNQAVNNLAYRFNGRLRATNFYQNGFFEYVPGGSWAFRVKTALAQRSDDRQNNLHHNDLTYASFFVNQAMQPVVSFGQTIRNRQISWHNEAGAFFKEAWGQTSVLIRHEFQQLEADKRGLDKGRDDPMANVPDFTLPLTQRQFQKWGAGVGQSVKLGDVQLAGEFFQTISTFPLQNGTRQMITLPEYKFSFDYQPGTVDHVMISWTGRVSSFSLHKVMAGFTLRDFQVASIIGPAQLTPQPEEVAEIWIGKNFSAISLMVDPTLIIGRTRTTDRVVIGSLPVVTWYDQLKARYLAASLPFTKTFRRIPLQLILEPEMLHSLQENFDQAERPYNTLTERYLLGLKVNSDFDKKTIHFVIYPKYSAFRFSSAVDPTVSVQHMTSLEATMGWSITKHLTASTTWRYVVFQGTSDSRFTNGALQIRYNHKDIVVWLEGDNILNNRTFIRQTISPNVFINNNEAVFGRYVKLGIDLKFR